MKSIYLVIALCIVAISLHAYTERDQQKKFARFLSDDSVLRPKFSITPCSGMGSTLMLSNVEGEMRNTGDNDPANGAFMRWTASGGTGLYFSQLLKDGVTYSVSDPGTGVTVFGPNNGASYDEEVIITEEFNGECLPDGDWTVRLWEVVDDNGDRQPDRDGSGNIVGCYVEQTFRFFPSCADLGTNVPFTVDVRNLGCNNDGGRINLLDFQEHQIYCVDNDGNGASFTWTGPDGFTATTRDVSGLTPGNYIVEMRDFYGCTFRWRQDIDDLRNLGLTCSVRDSLSEFGSNDGTIVVEPFAGSENYTLTWTGPVAGSRPNIGIGEQTISGLPAGSYFFTVVDNESGCEETCSLDIPVPPCLIDFAVVYDETAQTVTVTPLDGTAEFFLSYFGPTMAENIGPFGFEGVVLPESDFLLGNYVFVLSEANRPDCAISQTFFIPPECRLFAAAAATPPSCFGGSDGVISISVADNIGPVTYDWSNDLYDGQATVSGLAAGTYTIRISDSAACFFTPLVVDLVDPPPLTVAFELSAAGCTEEDTNTLRAIVSGATGAVSYRWSVPAPDTNRIEGLAVGTYSVTVSDELGCSGMGTFTIVEPEPLTMNCTASPESIVGAADGSILVAHAGALAGVILEGDLGPFPLRPNADTLLSGLPPGTYRLVLLNPNGCRTNCTATVEPGRCVLEATAEPEQPNCTSATGSATARARNARGPLQYAWSHGPTTATVSDLPVGDYVVTVRDTFGCQATDTVTILPFTNFPELSAASPTPACPRGGCTEVAFQLTGTPPFVISYEIDQPGSPTISATFSRTASGTQVFCPAEFGYTTLDGASIFLRDVTDGNGCSRSVNRLLRIPVFPAAVGTLDTVLCAGDTFRYFGETFSAARPGGEVSLPFSSANGCDTSTLVSVSFLAPALGALNPTLCAGDTFTLAGATFTEFRPSGEVRLPAAAASGCDSLVRVAVTYLPPARGTLRSSRCDGDTLRVGDETFSAARPFGRVLLSGASVNGCDSIVDVDLRYFPPARGTLNTTLCFGDTLRFSGQLFHANRRSGEVILPTASANGCDSTVSVFVDVLTPGRSILDTTICRIDTLVYHGEVFNVYRMSGEVVVPTPAANGCDSIVSVTIRYFPQNFEVFDTVICQGDGFFHEGVFFDEAVDNFSIPLPGASINGCDSLTVVFVQVKSPATINLSGEGIVCPDGSLEVTLAYDGIVPATVILTDRPTDPITITADTTVLLRDVSAGERLQIVAVDDGSDCPPAFGGFIDVRATNLEVDITIDSGDGTYAVSCAAGSDGAVTAIPSGGDAPYTFLWNTGDTGPILRGLPPGEYAVSVTSNRGCQARSAVNLASPDLLSLQVTEVDADCRDSLPVLIVRNISGGLGPYAYRLAGDPGFRPAGDLPDTLSFPFGSTLFQLEDLNGCRLEQAFSFSPPEPGRILVTPARSLIRIGDSVELKVFTDLEAVGYYLSPGPDTPLTEDRFYVAPRETTTYTVTAFDAEGCTVTDTAEVLVDRVAPVYVPNIFSPNGDDVNDIFEAYADKEVVTLSEFEVFERWGGRVYSFPGPVPADAVGWGWDGKNAAGKLYEQHVYVYSLKVTYTDGREVYLQGDVMLVR